MNRSGKKTAIITGGSRGLGLALLEHAVRRFDDVVVIGRTPPPDELGGAPVHMIEADLGAEAIDWNALFRAEQAIVGAGELVFFDNAAVHQPTSVCAEDLGRKLADAVVVNLVAPAAIVGALLRLADELGARLTLIHIGTGAAVRPIEGWAPYCASKAAAAMLFDVIALERPDVSIRKVDPGVVDTAMQAAIRNGPDVPSRSYFRRLKEEGALQTPAQAAARVFAELAL